MSGPLLEVHDLKTQFFTPEGVVKAVDGVSFELNAGETLGIVGESGCGKSVTALSLMRLIPPPGRIVGGRVLYDGSDLTKLSESEMQGIRGESIAMIFQDPMTSLNPVFKVGWQVGEPLMLHRSETKAKAFAGAVSVLGKVGIPSPGDRARDYPHHFSGGMRQRAMIAMGLTTTPKVLIADEPTTALDVTIQAQILELLADLQAPRHVHPAHHAQPGCGRRNVRARDGDVRGQGRRVGPDRGRVRASKASIYMVAAAFDTPPGRGPSRSAETDRRPAPGPHRPSVRMRLPPAMHLCGRTVQT